MTGSENDYQLAMEEWLRAARAAYKGLKAQTPEGAPWSNAMLMTEHLRSIATSLVIQLNRRGMDPPAAVSHPGSAPAARAGQQGLGDDRTADSSAKTSAKRQKAPAATANAVPEPGRGSFVCSACQETKIWRMDWGPFPDSVCIECYKGGRKA